MSWKLCRWCVALGILLPSLSVLAGGEDKEGRALLDKVLAAVAGDAPVSQYHGLEAKGSGTIHELNQKIMFTTDSYVQVPQRYRFEMELNINGNKVPQVYVFLKDKGWLKGSGKPADLPPAVRENFFNLLYAMHVAAIPWELKKKDYQLSPLGEIMVSDRPALGLRVVAKDRPDVNLFFDKQSYLPVKGEIRAKTIDTVKEVSHDFYYSEHKEFMGLKLPTRVIWKQDDTLFLEREFSAIRPVEKLDDGLFERP